jgi:hypothetical protein
VYISYYRYIYRFVVVRARASFAIFVGESSETGLQPMGVSYTFRYEEIPHDFIGPKLEIVGISI